jgi:hypothetical protein
MTPEQERLLHEVHAGVTSSNIKLDEMSSRLSAHETADNKVHTEVQSLVADREKAITTWKTVRTVLKVAAAVIPPIATAAWWLADKVLAQ